MPRIQIIMVLISLCVISLLQWHVHATDTLSTVVRPESSRRKRTSSNISISTLALEPIRRTSIAEQVLEVESEESEIPPPSVAPPSPTATPPLPTATPPSPTATPPSPTALSRANEANDSIEQHFLNNIILQRQERRMRRLLACSCIQNSLLVVLLIQSSVLFRNVSHITTDVVDSLGVSINNLQRSLDGMGPDINHTLSTVLDNQKLYPVLNEQLNDTILRVADLASITNQLKDKIDILGFNPNDLNTTLESIVLGIQEIPVALSDNFAIVNGQLFELKDSLFEVTPSPFNISRQFQILDNIVDSTTLLENRFDLAEDDRSTLLLTVAHLRGKLNQLDGRVDALSYDIGLLRGDTVGISGDTKDILSFVTMLDHNFYEFSTSLDEIQDGIRGLPERIGNLSSILNSINDRFDGLELGLGISGRDTEHITSDSKPSIYVLDPYQKPSPVELDKQCPLAYASFEGLLGTLRDCYDMSGGGYTSVPEIESHMASLFSFCPQAAQQAEQTLLQVNQCFQGIIS